MEPEQKGNLILSLKEENLTVCMCGDGANDNIALRVADVGISLTKEESSIAASFTSIIPLISLLLDNKLYSSVNIISVNINI